MELISEVLTSLLPALVLDQSTDADVLALPLISALVVVNCAGLATSKP